MEISKIISASIEAGATAAYIKAGLMSPEISQRMAAKTYGVWFTDAVKDKRISPCRIGEGKSGKKWYSVNDILTLWLTDTMKCEIVWKKVSQSKKTKK